MTPQEFVSKWKRLVADGVSEKAVAQSHFIELCQVLEVDPPTGTDDTFEKGLEKSTGGHGWAAVTGAAMTGEARLPPGEPDVTHAFWPLWRSHSLPRDATARVSSGLS